MYNPPAWEGVSGDAFEFLELKNVGPEALDLGGLSFTAAQEKAGRVPAFLLPARRTRLWRG